MPPSRDLGKARRAYEKRDITTFAVVSGVAGAALSTGIVLILGFANLLAGLA